MRPSRATQQKTRLAAGSSMTRRRGRSDLHGLRHFRGVVLDDLLDAFADGEAL
jgi:hypothetical protein